MPIRFKKGNAFKIIEGLQQEKVTKIWFSAIVLHLIIPTKKTTGNVGPDFTPPSLRDQSGAEDGWNFNSYWHTSLVALLA